MNTFGVCKCDLRTYDYEIRDLKRFNEYNEALAYYMKLWKANEIENYNLWIVYIDEYNRIVQFQQLVWQVKCKIVELENDNT